MIASGMGTGPIIPRLVKMFDPLLHGQRWERLENTLNTLTVESADLFFVQIGANDGVVHDPLYHHVVSHRWRGILVEPVKFYFDRLTRNYADNDRLIFENIAISDKDEVRDFFRIREGLDFLPAWTEGLGSFHLSVLLKHRWAIPNIRDYIVRERVECVSLPTLLGGHRVSKIDLMMIDTEGYDFFSL